MPDSSFSVSDVRNLVGGKRVLEVIMSTVVRWNFTTNIFSYLKYFLLHHQVMNCATQTNSQMLLRDWEEFFTHPERDDTKLNVISLEFSQTKLESYVTAPR